MLTQEGADDAEIIVRPSADGRWQIEVPAPDGVSVTVVADEQAALALARELRPGQAIRLLPTAQSFKALHADHLFKIEPDVRMGGDDDPDIGTGGLSTSVGVIQLGTADAPPSVVQALLGALCLGDAFIGFYDERDTLRFANEAFLRAFNVRAGEDITFSGIVLRAYEQKISVRIEAADPHAFIVDAQLRRRILAQAPRQRSFAVDFVNGEWYWCTETLFPNGWIVLSGSNITALKNTERNLEEARDRAVLLSHVDELTGIPNRRFSMTRLDRLLERATLSQSPLSVAVLDLDRFKSINDTYGHHTGDEALRHFARHCMSGVRATDFLGRLGGQEFIVLLPNTSPVVAKQIIERILGTLPDLVTDWTVGQAIRLSFSAGIAQFEGQERREDVVARADKALYSAKTAGRAQVHIRTPC